MDKSPEAFRTISEVAELLETPAHVLRFWETRFSQIKPVKRAGGRRYYRPSDVALLGGIRKLLHDDGMTIRGVQQILRDQGIKAVSGMASATLAPADEPAEPVIEVVAEAASTAISDNVVALTDWLPHPERTEPVVEVVADGDENEAAPDVAAEETSEAIILTTESRIDTAAHQTSFDFGWSAAEDVVLLEDDPSSTVATPVEPEQTEAPAPSPPPSAEPAAPWLPTLFRAPLKEFSDADLQRLRALKPRIMALHDRLTATQSSRRG
jgi:DNA-binding transcriptional MerR regulator